MNSMEEQDKKKKIFSLRTWIAFAALAFLKLYFTSTQHLFAIGQGTHDDRLFVNLANNLLKGIWLGKYNNLTLSKGPFFSMWMALANLAHIPLLFSEQLLYVLASLILIIALRPAFKRTWPLVLIFTFVLFNPMSFTDGAATRAMREGLYQPLTLLLTALFIGLMLRTRHSPKTMLTWSIGAGMVFSAFWLTREEGIWIIPFAILAIAYALYEIWKEKIRPFKMKLFFLVLPFILLGVSVFTVSSINYKYYGIFHTVEFKAPEFLNAYGAMTRIKDDQWLPDVPVSTDKRMKIYAVSPAFSELQPAFEGKLGTRWINTSSKNVNSFDIKEIRGGWFMWAFRDAVDRAGYYKDGDSTMKFYRRMADEINAACDKKELDCYPERSSMNPPWNSAYNKPFFTAIAQAAIYSVRLDGFNPIPTDSVGDGKSLRLFKSVTNNESSGGNTGFRMNMLAADGKIYQFALPFLAVLALIVFFASAFNKKIIQNKLWMISLLLLSLIAVRFILLAIIHVTSFPAVSVLYLSPIYPIILLFVALNLIPAISFLLKKFRTK